eukprot:CAMPEP_0203764888 /NCGR_PEP_ID=MMETSP0098-20131031/18112_1 /ASSEMBLY_ACC=CAM_ASM_000208 /TAXON_ID=96639 /ORGANISM=" , Strain NY0313808BC1" /LENGTH=858 /DNA_ID=CAMNT_0050661089 /DNA_START=574 /DNA_END=3146 /DNA_ORIENTATION=+
MMKAIVFASTLVLGTSNHHPGAIPPGNDCVWSSCTDIRSFKDSRFGPCDEDHPYWSMNTIRSSWLWEKEYLCKPLQYKYQCCKYKIEYPEGSKWTSKLEYPNTDHPYLPYSYNPGHLSYNCYWDNDPKKEACRKMLGDGYVNAGPKAVNSIVASTVASNWNYCTASKSLYYCMPEGGTPIMNRNMTCEIGKSSQHRAECFAPRQEIDIPSGNRIVTLYNMTYGTDSYGLLIQLEYEKEMIVQMNVSLQGYPDFYVDFRRDPTCNIINPSNTKVLIERNLPFYKTWFGWTLPDGSKEHAQLSWRCNVDSKTKKFEGMTIELEKLDEKYDGQPRKAVAHEEEDYHGICTCEIPPTPFPTRSPTKSPTASPTNKPTASPTKKPTSSPTNKPTASPTKKPTSSPTNKPTASPTKKPTSSPTNKPTASPTKKPTSSPTNKPTASPTKKPTSSPTNKPTSSPSKRPTASPTKKPTASPTASPTKRPTGSPTASPTPPTSAPTMAATLECTLVGDPHFTSFANNSFDVLGTNPYTIYTMPSDDYWVVGKNVAVSKQQGGLKSYYITELAVGPKDNMVLVEKCLDTCQGKPQDGGSFTYDHSEGRVHIVWTCTNKTSGYMSVSVYKENFKYPNMAESLAYEIKSQTNSSSCVDDRRVNYFEGMTIELEKLDEKYDGQPRKAVAHEEEDYHGICTCETPPTPSPTRSPTKSPTASPTKKPTASPTNKPTMSPTRPTSSPTNKPTKRPTNKPTSSPTSSPTNSPTASPTNKPTSSPSKRPTSSPTNKPTASPTKKPTSSPTKRPTASPTNKPTTSPTSSPTNKPTASPTKRPTGSPTNKPTASPTNKPTSSPTSSPTNSPTASPTNKP